MLLELFQSFEMVQPLAGSTPHLVLCYSVHLGIVSIAQLVQSGCCEIFLHLFQLGFGVFFLAIERFWFWHLYLDICTDLTNRNSSMNFAGRCLWSLKLLGPSLPALITFHIGSSRRSFLSGCALFWNNNCSSCQIT